MSALIYGTGQSFTLGEGNTNLAYIHAVTHHLFKRGSEGFTLAVIGTDDAGDDVRHFLWMHPSIPLQFVFDPGERVELDGDVFEYLLDDADDTGVVTVGDLLESSPYSFRDANAQRDTAE